MEKTMKLNKVWTLINNNVPVLLFLNYDKHYHNIKCSQLGELGVGI